MAYDNKKRIELYLLCYKLDWFKTYKLYCLNILQSLSIQPMQLAIDECEEWIWDTLDSTKDCGFEHIKDGNKEFLIFNTNDFFAEG